MPDTSGHRQPDGRLRPVELHEGAAQPSAMREDKLGDIAGTVPSENVRLRTIGYEARLDPVDPNDSRTSGNREGDVLDVVCGYVEPGERQPIVIDADPSG